MSTIRLFSVFNILSLLVHISMSTVTQMKWVNSLDVGEVSARYPSLFTPAGYTFAIWGIIYLALLAMCIYHCWMSFTAGMQHAANVSISQMSYWFIINNIATAGWLYFFTHQQIAVSEILILIQLLSLVRIHAQLHLYNQQDLLVNKLLTQIPLSIYLGWISVATIANTAVFLQDIGWNQMGASDAFWTSIMIGIATIITSMMVLIKRNLFYGLVFIWALFGILMKLHELGTPPAPIITTTWAGIGITGVAVIMRLFRYPNAVKQLGGNFSR